MAQKLSPYKLSKMMSLYFEGYSQSWIANKLNINQATVSLHVGKFKTIANEQGLEAAAKEYKVMDEVESLHSLAAELKKTKKTVEEAKVGLKMAVILQGCGINQEDYPDLVQACAKALSEKVADLAVRLFDQLQADHGLGARHRLLLRVAGLLHEVGSVVSSRAHHKHSYYLIANAEIFGLGPGEISIVAHVARYHRRSVPKPTAAAVIGPGANTPDSETPTA